MDALTKKSKRDYNHTSRYAPFYFYYHKDDNKYIYGITSNLRDDTEYTLHMVHDNDTLDGLALKYYGRPDLYWVIADFNRIHDPYIKLREKFNFIYIPSLGGFRYNR